MSSVSEAIVGTRLIAIVRLENHDRAAEISLALVAGGIKVIEFPLTGQGVYNAVAQSRKAVEGTAHIGVGTVLNASQAKDAVSAGAEFVVTPTLNLDTLECLQRLHTPVVCGAFSPTEVLTAHEAGADFVKLFPARLGGPQYVRDLLAPLPKLKLVPTGGVSLENAAAYLEAGAIALAIGGSLISASNVAEGNWSAITMLARQLVAAVQPD